MAHLTCLVRPWFSPCSARGNLIDSPFILHLFLRACPRGSLGVRPVRPAWRRPDRYQLVDRRWGWARSVRSRCTPVSRTVAHSIPACRLRRPRNNGSAIAESRLSPTGISNDLGYELNRSWQQWRQARDKLVAADDAGDGGKIAATHRMAARTAATEQAGQILEVPNTARALVGIPCAGQPSQRQGGCRCARSWSYGVLTRNGCTYHCWSKGFPDSPPGR
jgi:hypothetical protein